MLKSNYFNSLQTINKQSIKFSNSLKLNLSKCSIENSKLINFLLSNYFFNFMINGKIFSLI